MSSGPEHPYLHLPDAAFWRRSISSVELADVDPVMDAPFRLTPADSVATAGSCFAQHIARHLSAGGYNYFVTETAHPLASDNMATAYGYGDFTARYGNIYTARQLLQTFDRAYGKFEPSDNVWTTSNGSYIDPFRPQIQPNGYPNPRALRADRKQHLGAVRRAFEELDVFVFTLGLTECWLARHDGAAFPLCPGVAGGEFDADRYEFTNFSVDDVVADLSGFLDRLASVNPSARTILTVSPVPLIATASGAHVLSATTYSKSVLRVAADIVASRYPQAVYFPSYEIITGPQSRGAYFADDRRSVNEAGVSHVMRLFMQHYGAVKTIDPGATPSSETKHTQHTRDMEDLVEANCDEEALDR